MIKFSQKRNQPADISRAKKLRKNSSPVEKELWLALRLAVAALKLRFRRQHPIHPYIVDFACMKARLIVEVDGDTHVGQSEKDRVREDYLCNKGYKVLRFSNQQVVENKEGVVQRIIEEAVMRGGDR